MDPLVQAFLAEVLPVLGWTALVCALFGAALGGMLGAVLAWAGRRSGWWDVPSSRARLWARLTTAAVVIGTAGWGATVAGLGGAMVAAGPAVLHSEVGRTSLPTWVRPMVEAGYAALSLVVEVDGDAVPPADVRAGARELAVRLTGPDGAAFETELVQTVSAAVPEADRARTEEGVERLVAELRSGRDPSTLDASLAGAWRRLEVAAAWDGDPTTLTVDEAVELVVADVVVPVSLRPVRSLVVPGLLLATLAWLGWSMLVVGGAAAARRLASRTAVEESPGVG